MKRKLLSLLLAMLLTSSLMIPAAAAEPAENTEIAPAVPTTAGEDGDGAEIPTVPSEETADQRLAAVTAKVKETLQLDTETYTEFSGDLDEDPLSPIWNLYWSNETANLSVSATEEGKILSYYYYDDSQNTSGSQTPSFPKGSRTAARTAAQTFLNQILTEDESIQMQERGTDSLNATVYRFYGNILVNGLPAGLSFSIAVRCADNQIRSFSRDDLESTTMGGIPSNKADVTASAAGSTLKDTLEMRLEYVLEEEDSTHAILRYLPESTDSYYVDAATGELVNLTEIAADVDRGNGSTTSSGTAAEDAESDLASETPSLSGAEQSGIEKLEGVLDKTALDSKARAITALGLESYTLSTVNYTVPKGADAEDPDTVVRAALRYGKQVESRSWTRTVTLDAKTGEVLEVYSSAWLSDNAETPRTVNAETAQTTAETFLKELCPEQFSDTELYDSSDALEQTRTVSHSFQFARKANGYFFPDNNLRVNVDSTDGSISGYSNTFDDSITFDSPDGILTMAQAVEAWLDTYTVQLQYVQVPTAVDYSQPEYAELEDYGIQYLYKLVLGYALSREESYSGIDAKSGEAVVPEWSKTTKITYSDISDHWAKNQIETLAQYNVGYLGGSFQPSKTLTQLDLVALLVSMEGYLYDPDEANAADEVYQIAYDMGALTREERDDNAVLTRMDTIRMILDAMGYGSIARLDGIFQTRFTDSDTIPAEDYGYAALAQGLGMAAGNVQGQLQPLEVASRAQAAVFLYNLLSR